MIKVALQMIRFLIILPIKFYQVCISSLFPPSCRHIPTCSQYAIEAIGKHGVFKGFHLAFKRILTCHPRGTHGYDPVPPPKPNRQLERSDNGVKSAT